VDIFILQTEEVKNATLKKEKKKKKEPL